MDRSAKWIHPSSDRHTVDYHWLARREFRLVAKPQTARIEITACDRYRLYVNGVLVGQGPPRSEWPEIYVDTWSSDELPLVRGRNVIAVIAHNTGLAQHGQPPGPGGLKVQLKVTLAAGRRLTVSSNRSWRQLPAPQYTRPAPRRMFPVGFTEVCDLRRLPDGWTEPGFDDSAWAAAEVVDFAAELPYTDEKPCPLPPLVVEPTRPVGLGRCGRTAGMSGITGVPFEFCVFCCRDDEFYGASFVYSPKKQKVRLGFAADNLASVFLNNRRVLNQGNDDGFFNHLHYETDTYAGLYHGHGHRVAQAEATLERGWNSVGVVIGSPQDTWGYVLRFADPETGKTLPLKFSPNRVRSEVPAWQIISDSHVGGGDSGMLLEMPSLNEGTFPSPAHLAAWERRKRGTIEGAENLLARGKVLRLPPEGFVTYRLPAELIGSLELEVRGEAGAAIDVTVGEVLRDDGCVDSLRDRLWLTDRVILSNKWTRWRSLERRAGRYIELVARNATKPIEIRNLVIQAKHYPPPAPATFRSSDRVFNKLWTSGVATLDACTQEQFEDCPIREMAQWLGDAVVEGQIAAVAWGDAALTAKALRQYAADQPVGDWIRPMVPSGYGDKLVDYTFLLPYLLHRHWMHWGDESVVRDCFTALTRLLAHAETFVRDDLILTDDNPKNMVYLDHTLGPRTSSEPGRIIPGYQAAYAVALEYSAAVAEALGQRARAARWRKRRDRTARAVQRRLFDEGEGLYPDMMPEAPGEPVLLSATTNYWMLFGGVATAAQERRILERLWPVGATREGQSLWPPRENPYFKYFVLEALFRRGMWPQAFAVIRNYYGPMMSRPDFWTIYEMYDPRTPPREPVESNSHCHAYGAGPLVHFFRWICGLRPLEPGFARTVVEPQIGDLSRLSATMHTPAGEVALVVTPVRRGRRIRVTAPEGMAIELRPTYLRPGDRLERA
jgi:alpha-L-rhamnosidase